MVERSNPTLKRSLNLPLLLFYGVGNILGAGIYVLVGEVAGIAGYYAPVAFVVSALIAAITAVTYMELSSRMPKSGGEAVYVDQAFNRPMLSRLVGLLVCFGGIVSSATLSRGFVGYFELFVALPDVVSICLLLLLLGTAAVIGITESVTVATVLTVIEMAGLFLILWVGGDAFLRIPEQMPALIPPLAFAPWVGIIAGAFLAFYAFIGFEDMVNVAEEVKTPQRTVPLAIILAMVICTLLYGAIALVAVLQVEPEVLGEQDAPLAYIYQQATGRAPVVMGLFGLCAIVNGVLIQIIMVSRVLYGMAQQGLLPEVLASVHTRFRTPVRSTVLTVLIILALAVLFPLVTLASITSFAVLLVFVSVNAALFKLKLTTTAAPDVVEVPMIFPFLGMVSSLFLAASSFLF